MAGPELRTSSGRLPEPLQVLASGLRSWLSGQCFKRAGRTQREAGDRGDGAAPTPT